jgi:molybdopterin synthase sulfur carrier subunit
MTLTVKYFGMTAEASGKSEEELLESYGTTQELKEALQERHPKLGSMNFKMAVNQTMIAGDFDLIGNEEVALLPPFAGG